MDEHDMDSIERKAWFGTFYESNLELNRDLSEMEIDGIFETIRDDADYKRRVIRANLALFRQHLEDITNE